MLELKGPLEECVLPTGLGRWKVASEMDCGVESISVLERSVGLAGMEPAKRGISLACALQKLVCWPCGERRSRC